LRVIGTAGHVDHGKSTLIAALTGIHPDRLKEEQEREMTIELGFGWLILPGGQEIGIVDVPGHRDFIENMLAGVGGIDAALLVIAADEGVMPQTREHLAILDLLEIQRGLVVISKIDMLDDPEWLDMVENDIRGVLIGTVLEKAPMIRVSARVGTGLEELKRVLENLLQDLPERLDLGRPRLPVDRVFSMPGFGTVVTGTLSDGRLQVGAEIELLPSGRTGRVRGLQTHKKKEDVSIPGSRTAVNISGIAVDEIARGETLVTPGHYQVTRRFDARLRLVRDLTAVLKHGTEVKVFTGTSESMAKVRILGADDLNAAEQGWIQLELRNPLAVVRGDRFILRRPSPGETLGGGQVVDPHPSQRHKRFDEQVLKNLESLSHGSPSEVLFQAALALGAAPIRDVIAKARLQSDQAWPAAIECIQTGLLTLLDQASVDNPKEEDWVMPVSHWNDLRANILSILESYHRSWPLRRGMPREELKSRLKISPRLYSQVTARLEAQEGALQTTKSWLALPGHAVQFSPTQKIKIAGLLQKFEIAPFAPPSVKESQAEVGEDVFAALLELSDLIQVSAEVVFRRTDYDLMVARITAAIHEHGPISAAGVRDLFGTSRKFALGLLEHLDAIGVTIRDGDFRRLRS
jgi:selenocysteine-specific elongation factor